MADRPPILEPLMTLRLILRPSPIGDTPFGERSEIFFEGTATSTLWEGRWEASGVDHIRRSTSGISQLDVHAIVGDGPEAIAYHGIGRGGPEGIVEGVTFETASDRFGWLNSAVGVGRAIRNDERLLVELFTVRLVFDQSE